VLECTDRWKYDETILNIGQSLTNWWEKCGGLLVD